MDNKIWYHDELDLTKAVEEKELKEIQDYVIQNKQLIMHLWETEQMPQLKRTLQFGSAELNYVYKWLESLPSENRLYLVFLLGTLAGAVECTDRNLYVQDHAERMTNELKKMTTTKHLPETVLALETHGMMTHAELCGALGLNASTLTEAMKKILQTGMVKASAYGKYKLYQLTEEGRQFGRTIRKMKAENEAKGRFPASQTGTLHAGDKLAIFQMDRGTIRTDRFMVDMILQENNQRPDGEIRIACRKQEALGNRLSNSRYTVNAKDHVMADDEEPA